MSRAWVVNHACDEGGEVVTRDLAGERRSVDPHSASRLVVPDR
jgi:hypothetical protein